MQSKTAPQAFSNTISQDFHRYVQKEWESMRVKRTVETSTRAMPLNAHRL
jgi:hypothetical protein